jgi:hypothetical protein
MAIFGLAMAGVLGRMEAVRHGGRDEGLYQRLNGRGVCSSPSKWRSPVWEDSPWPIKKICFTYGVRLTERQCGRRGQRTY